MREVNSLQTVGGMKVADRSIAGSHPIIPLRELLSMKHDNVTEAVYYKVRICCGRDIVQSSFSNFSPETGLRTVGVALMVPCDETMFLYKRMS